MDDLKEFNAQANAAEGQSLQWLICNRWKFIEFDPSDAEFIERCVFHSFEAVKRSMTEEDLLQQEIEAFPKNVGE